MTAFTEEWITSYDGTKLYSRRYLPAEATGGLGKWGASAAKAAVLFIHGFIEHIARYEHVFPAYAERGIVVLTYDQRGFGKSALDAANKSSSAKYGKTSWAEQHADIQHMLGVLREGISVDVPIFLMGHSMGGGLVLSFPTRPPDAPFVPKAEVLIGVAGVIATSPLIRQTHPAPAWKVAAGGFVSKLAGGLSVPAEVKPEDLSHDPAVGEAYKNDPFVKFFGTAKGVSDMLTGGKQLIERDVTNWPPDLPLLVIHGTDDQVTSCPTSELFVREAPAKDKTFVPFEGGYHELQNEPGDVKEKLIETVTGWVLDHIEKQAKL